MKKISQTERVARSRHTGEPIFETLNTVYGYWGTVRYLSDAEFRAYMLPSVPEYTGPMHAAEKAFRTSLYL